MRAVSFKIKRRADTLQDYEQDSSAGIVTRPRVGKPRSHDLITGKNGKFYLLKNVHSRSGANPTSSSMGLSPPPSAQVKSEWCTPNLSPNALWARREETSTVFTHK